MSGSGVWTSRILDVRLGRKPSAAVPSSLWFDDRAGALKDTGGEVKP